MFDKLSDAAEKLATNVSRRAFLGGLGKGALAMAGALAGMLASPAFADAGLDHYQLCAYNCGGRSVRMCYRCNQCPRHVGGLVNGCNLLGAISACTCNSDCTSC